MQCVFSSLAFREYNITDLGQFVYEVVAQFPLYLELIIFGIS